MWMRAFALFSDKVLGGDDAVIKNQLGHGGAAHTKFIDVMRSRETGAFAVNDERRNLAVELSVDEETVSFAAVCNVGLRAVETIGVTLFDRQRRHAEDVCSSAWLGHAHPTNPFAAEHLRQIFCPECGTGGEVEVVYEQHRVGQIGETEARVGLRELVVDDHGSDGIHACASVLVGNRDPQQAQLTELAEQLNVECAEFVMFRSLRLNFILREFSHHFA